MTQQSTRRLSASPFATALLLADREANAAFDKIALRALGISRLRSAFSGLEVARHLAAKVSRVLVEESEVIVCLPQLQDMSAVQFATLIRTHPLLVHIPLLAIASDPAMETALKQSGFNEVLLRPFNTTTLGNTLHSVARSAQVKHEALLTSLTENPGVPSHQAFDDLLPRFVPPDKNTMSPIAAYKYGVQLMRAYQWEDALPFLEKAAADTLTQGAASMALAAFWTVAQEPHKVDACLRDALQSFMDRQAWERAKQVAIRLNEEFPDTPCPLLPEIERRARQNQHETVMHLVGIARNVTTDQAIAAALLKGGRASLTPGLTLPTLLDNLREQGDDKVAALLSKEAGAEAKPAQGRWARFLGKKRGRDAKKAAPPANDGADIDTHPARDGAGNGPARKTVGIPIADEDMFVPNEPGGAGQSPAGQRAPGSAGSVGSAGTPGASYGGGGGAPLTGADLFAGLPADPSDDMPDAGGKLFGGESGVMPGVMPGNGPGSAFGRTGGDAPGWEKSQSPVIAPLDRMGNGGNHDFEASPLGDAWTMIKGTVHLNRKKNKA